MINSRHKKITITHPNLDVTAITKEGYKEIVELPDKTFYIAVKFHPESLYKFDENMNNIFRNFIKICK